MPRATVLGARREGTQSRARDRLPFLFLWGFVTTQGHLIPLVALNVNWALWPSLPDVFGFLLVVSVLLSGRRIRLNVFDRRSLKDLWLIQLFFILNVVLVTLPLSETGEGVKYGGYSIFIFGKYIAVYWAACQVRLDRRRMKALHIASLIAFAWISTTMLADRFGLIELDTLVSHLPRGSAGKWSTVGLNSTVSNTHGQTAVVILLLAGLAIATAQYRMSWLVEACVLILAVLAVFFTGSRQGLVRIMVFAAVLLMKDTRRLILIVSVALVVGTTISLLLGPQKIAATPGTAVYVERQLVLLTDPLSNEGLSGRPELWVDVVEGLSEKPWRWVVGYGMGNYVEHGNSAHNMLLGLLQDGGLIAVLWVGGLWLRILRRIWRIRTIAWPLVAMSSGLLSSVMTSGIFMPNLSTGWYLGLYFVSFHIVPRFSGSEASPGDKRRPETVRRLRLAGSRTLRL